MATFPSKVNYTTGDVLTATEMNEIGQAINLLDGAQYSAGKNKFINANMAIAQRGATAVAVGTRTFSVDRTFGQLVGAGAFTVEQAVDAPAAANASQYSLKAVVTTADTSIAASDQYFLGQVIEAGNFASFQFGTASAQTVTISFWVKSSISGNFAVSIRNSAADRSYVATYTISAANTWEKKTVTIAGDTSGTWLKDIGIGARIEWTLSAGSDYQTATANAWTASNDQTTSAQTNWMATLANTFNITAIQMEAASTASPFQLASGSTGSELALCQRYYFRTTASAGSQTATGIMGITNSTTNLVGVIRPPVTMRAIPGSVEFSAVGVQTTGSALTAISAITISADTTSDTSQLNCTSSGFTANLYGLVRGTTGAGYVALNAEI